MPNPNPIPDTNPQSDFPGQEIGDAFIDCFQKLSETYPERQIMLAMIAALCSLATTSGITRDKILAALNTYFDRIENLQKNQIPEKLK